jgi:FKBP-type peptidyl-prolyl cis-trans isomerase 2
MLAFAGFIKRTRAKRIATVIVHASVALLVLTEKPNFWIIYMLLTLRISRWTPLLGLMFVLTHPALAADAPATVEKGKQVGFTYKLTVEGEVIDSNEDREPMVYIQGGGQILPALEAELQGMKVNDKKTIKLDAANAYGEVNPEAIQEVPTEQIPEGARQAGAVLQAQGYPGPIRVVEVKEDVTIVDFNHPLAGKALTFDITIASIETPPPAPAAAPATAPEAADEKETVNATPSAAETAEPSAKTAN